MSQPASPRPARVAQLLQQEVGQLLARGLKDPRLSGFITVTGAKLSPDLREGIVYYSVFGDEKVQAETHAGLVAAAAYLQREAAKGLRLRVVPHLRFVFDESIARGDKIERLLKEAKKKESPPEPVDPPAK